MIKSKVLPIFELFPEIKLAYFFGSRAENKTGPLSDYDFAIFLEEKSSKKIIEIKLSLLGKLSKALKTDNVDLVVLNTTESPELKYNIIKEGKLILKKDPYQLLVEPKILTEYFDFKIWLEKYNLTKKQ